MTLKGMYCISFKAMHYRKYIRLITNLFFPAELLLNFNFSHIIFIIK